MKKIKNVFIGSICFFIGSCAAIIYCKGPKISQTEFMPIVKIPGKTYSFGKYEVTQGQYESVMGENPSTRKAKNLPVDNISINNAISFCKKLTTRERLAGNISGRQEYRLPTFEEWVHACRAGTTTKYYTGETEKSLDHAAWHKENCEIYQAIGQKTPNNFGLYDMLGNVWELIEDGLIGGGYDDGPRDCRIPSTMREIGFCGDSRRELEEIGPLPGVGMRVVLDEWYTIP